MILLNRLSVAGYCDWTFEGAPFKWGSWSKLLHFFAHMQVFGYFLPNRIELYVFQAAYMQYVLAFMWHTEHNFIFFF